MNHRLPKFCQYQLGHHSGVTAQSLFFKRSKTPQRQKRQGRAPASHTRQSCSQAVQLAAILWSPSRLHSVNCREATLRDTFFFHVSHTYAWKKKKSNGLLIIPHATMRPPVLSVIEISCRSKHFFVFFRSKNKSEVQI